MIPTAPNFSAAQRTPTPSPPLFDPQPKLDPSLALRVIFVLGGCLFMVFILIYISRRNERRYSGNVNGIILGGGGGRFSRRVQQGLDAAVIGNFPTFLYSVVKGHKIGIGSLECAVCLNEFEDDETLRLIPKCCHVFHPDCIDAWLASHTTCPVCRADLVPIPGDIAFESDALFNTSNNEEQNDYSIRISDENDQNKDVSEPIQTPNRPPRSWSTGWRVRSLFPKSRSSGHLPIQRGENMERFTLRLPEEIRNQLLNCDLNRTKSCVAFPRAMSTRRGYRSRSGGSWLGKNYYYYERFEEEAQQADEIIKCESSKG